MNPVPKPKHKHNRAKNNPKPTIDDICTYEGCSAPYAHNHEAFFGTGQRQLSIKYKMQKRLCGIHHLGPMGPHHNREYDLQVKRECQRKFEAEYGHEKFIEVFGRSYL